ncbi:MAG: hypothetical protein NDJ89_04985 [Oligoflexia bacterium]|nr:hypothetical protein [Oligoflexia bacterium]
MKKLDTLEKSLDHKLEKLFSNPAFLGSISLLLNANSYRKLATNFALRQVWKALQLPNKRDQERTLHLIQELSHRIDILKDKLDRVRAEPSREQQPAPFPRPARRSARSEAPAAHA